MTANAERAAQLAADAASATAAKATYAGGALSAVGGIALSSELIALAGLGLALLGWFTQLYFGLRRDRRETSEHDLKVEDLRAHIREAHDE